MSEVSAPNVIKLKNVLASYFHGYQPKKGAKPRYESNFLLDPSNKAHAATILAIKQEAARVAKEKFGDKVDLKKLKLGFGTNDEDSKFCPGFFFVQTWSKLDDGPPIIVNRGREPTNGKDPESVYAGATVHTSTTAFAWEFTEKGEDGSKGITKRGVSFNLRPIQFVEKTPAFSQRSEIVIDEEFEALGDAANKASGEVGGDDPFKD